MRIVINDNKDSNINITATGTKIRHIKNDVWMDRTHCSNCEKRRMCRLIGGEWFCRECRIEVFGSAEATQRHS